MTEPLLTVDGLCEALTVTGSDGRKQPIGRNTAYNLVATGMIRHVRLGVGRNARILVPQSAVAEYLSGQRPTSLVVSVGSADPA